MDPLSHSSNVLSSRDIRERDNVPPIAKRGRGSVDLGFLLNETSINYISDLREFVSGDS